MYDSISVDDEKVRLMPSLTPLESLTLTLSVIFDKSDIIIIIKKKKKL